MPLVLAQVTIINSHTMLLSILCANTQNTLMTNQEKDWEKPITYIFLFLTIYIIIKDAFKTSIFEIIGISIAAGVLTYITIKYIIPKYECNVLEDEKMKEIQKYPDIDWKKLEKAIDDAIDKDEPYIIFKIIEPEECKYMLKVAEDRLSKLEIRINVIIFVAAVAVSFVVPLITTHEGKIGYLVGVIIIMIAIVSGLIWKQKYCACKKIILNGERKILWMDIKSKQSGFAN